MLKPFLDKYDTVIFDMDGVITSEDNYWNAAALTVCEYLESEHYLGSKAINAKKMQSELGTIRKKIFNDEKTIAALKRVGVNSNWDLGYVAVCFALILGENDFEKISAAADNINCEALELYDILAEDTAKIICQSKEYCSRSGKLWNDMMMCFQEWYLGDALYKEIYNKIPQNAGKPGLVFDEKPLIPMEQLHKLLNELSKDKRLCVGTGRPFAEIEKPLTKWNVRKYFAKDGLCNYDNVIAAEKALNVSGLTKPHPYMFLKALYGTDYSDKKILEGDYDISLISRTLIVGDAGSDILAAKAMGADFCAVLTGVQGKAAKDYFEEKHSDYILDSVVDMLD